MFGSHSLPIRLARAVLGGKPENPDLARIRDYARHVSQTHALGDYAFTVLDTELTGLNPAADAIVSIGAVRIRGLRVQPLETFQALVRPPIPLPKLSTLIHRITPEAVAEAPPLAEVLPDFLAFLGESLIVGHHVGLDMTFLNRALIAEMGFGLTTPCIDTMRLAQAYEADLWEGYYDQYNLNVSFTLDHLAQRYCLPCFTAHDALQDAMQTACLFLFLVKKLRGGSLRTMTDLFNVGRSWRWYF